MRRLLLRPHVPWNLKAGVKHSLHSPRPSRLHDELETHYKERERFSHEKQSVYSSFGWREDGDREGRIGSAMIHPSCMA